MAEKMIRKQAADLPIGIFRPAINFFRLNNDLPSNILIYNYVSKDNPITYNDLKKFAEKWLFEFSSNKSIWYYSFRL